jgi:hypothetical protein
LMIIITYIACSYSRTQLKSGEKYVCASISEISRKRKEKNVIIMIV